VLWMQQVWHYSAIKTGFGVAPGPLMVPLFAAVAHRLSRRVPIGALVALGCLLFAAGSVVMLSSVGAHPDYAGELLPGWLIGRARRSRCFPARGRRSLTGPARGAKPSYPPARIRDVPTRTERIVEQRLATQRLTSAPLPAPGEVVELLTCVQSQERDHALYSL